MTSHLHMTLPFQGAPHVELNEVTLERGRLLVTLGFGDHRADIAFNSVDELELWARASERALELGRQGQAVLDRQLADKQAKEQWVAEHPEPGAGLDHDPGDDPTCEDEDPLQPGDPIPPERTGGMTGFVVGECGHRVAGSEWQAGFRTCERCSSSDPDDEDEDDEDVPEQPAATGEAIDALAAVNAERKLEVRTLLRDGES
jgi:hypothetical protein